VIRRMATPEIHTLGWFEGELKYIPRAVWMYSRMKNREAPLVWIVRVTHPDFRSCEIVIMLEKAVAVFAEYSMDRISPVMICVIRVIPSRNPMFHRKEMEVGEGRSSREDFVIFVIGFFFHSCVFIKGGVYCLGWIVGVC